MGCRLPDVAFDLIVRKLRIKVAGNRGMPSVFMVQSCGACKHPIGVWPLFKAEYRRRGYETGRQCASGASGGVFSRASA